MDSVTVPLTVEGNRPLIDVSFEKPGGGYKSARFLVDTGGGGFLMLGQVARDLGIRWNETRGEQGETLGRPTGQVNASVGGFPLAIDASRVYVLVGRTNVLPPAAPGHADGMFPGHLLAQYHVVFDYPAQSFTLARRGALTPRGTPMPMPVSKRQGFPRTEIEVESVAHGLLLDTGASFTMVSEKLLNSWGAAHPDWERHEGAFGDAATLGGQTLETMFVPEARWGEVELSRLGVVSQQEGTFERWMSSMMSSPIVGSLAGNVLTRFRLELDYASETLYVSGA